MLRRMRKALCHLVAVLAAAPLGTAQPGNVLPPKTLRLYVFDSGTLYATDTSPYQLKKDEVATATMSMECFLIAHPKGTMIWDTGAVPDSRFKPGGAPGTMENLLAPFSLQASTLAWALGQSTKLQMIAVDDIGWFGARAFTDAAALNRREIDLAGDVRTMPEAAEILTPALGRPIAFAQTPIEQVRHYSKDMALMLEWFERVGYSADIGGLEREFGRPLTKLPDWAAHHSRSNGR